MSKKNAKVLILGNEKSKKIFNEISRKLLLAEGNGAILSQEDRDIYLIQYCNYLGLNPVGEPLRWDTRNSNKNGLVMKITAKAAASKQFIQKYKIDIERTDRWEDDENWYVEVKATKDGQSVVNIGFESKKGLGKGNALNSAYTKATKRAVLAISGSGMLDESEVATFSENTPQNTTPIEIQLPTQNGTQNKAQKSPRKRVDEMIDIESDLTDNENVYVDNVLSEMEDVVGGIDNSVETDFKNSEDETDNDFSGFSDFDVDEVF